MPRHCRCTGSIRVSDWNGGDSMSRPKAAAGDRIQGRRRGKQGGGLGRTLPAGPGDGGRPARNLRRSRGRYAAGGGGDGTDMHDRCPTAGNVPGPDPFHPGFAGAEPGRVREFPRGRDADGTVMGARASRPPQSLAGSWASFAMIRNTGERSWSERCHLGEQAGKLMNAVRLIPLGVGEAFTARHYTSCLALGVDDDWLLIDCPHPVRKMLREGSTRGRDSAGSRPHPRRGGDPPARRPLLRPGGLRLLLVLRAGPPGKLLMHPEVSARVWDGLLAAGMESSGEARRAAGPQAAGRLLRADRPGDSAPIECGPFAIECRRTIHAVPTLPCGSPPAAGAGLQRRHRLRSRPDRVALQGRPDRPRGDDDGALGRAYAVREAGRAARRSARRCG